MSVHSRLSPSSMARILQCPGSARSDLHDQRSEAADRGTELHAVADAICKGHVHEEPGVTDEERGWIEEYVKYVVALPGVKHYELRLVSELEPDHGGTIDCVAVTPTELHVADFKTGRLRVDVQDNKQLLSYLCLAREEFGRREKYFAHVIQPRLGTPVAVEVTNAQLDAHEQAVWAAAQSDELCAGPHCRWCPLALACETRQEYDREQARKTFEAHPGVHWCDEVISIAEVMAERKKLAEARLLQLALEGHPIPGRRLAQALGHRKWKDDKEAAVALRALLRGKEDFWETVAKSPATIEKIIGSKVGKDAVATLVTRPDLGPTLVSENSKLPPYNPQSFFTEITHEQQCPDPDRSSVVPPPVQAPTIQEGRETAPVRRSDFWPRC